MTEAGEKWADEVATSYGPRHQMCGEDWLRAFVREVRERRKYIDPFYTGEAFNDLVRDFGLGEER